MKHGIRTCDVESYPTNIVSCKFPLNNTVILFKFVPWLRLRFSSHAFMISREKSTIKNRKILKLWTNWIAILFQATTSASSRWRPSFPGQLQLSSPVTERGPSGLPVETSAGRDDRSRMPILGIREIPSTWTPETLSSARASSRRRKQRWLTIKYPFFFSFNHCVRFSLHESDVYSCFFFIDLTL